VVRFKDGGNKRARRAHRQVPASGQDARPRAATCTEEKLPPPQWPHTDFPNCPPESGMPNANANAQIPTGQWTPPLSCAVSRCHPARNWSIPQFVLARPRPLRIPSSSRPLLPTYASSDEGISASPSTLSPFCTARIRPSPSPPLLVCCLSVDVGKRWLR
jgi:hypothetical protein